MHCGVDATPAPGAHQTYIISLSPWLCAENLSSWPLLLSPSADDESAAVVCAPGASVTPALDPDQPLYARLSNSTPHLWSPMIDATTPCGRARVHLTAANGSHVLLAYRTVAYGAQRQLIFFDDPQPPCLLQNASGRTLWVGLSGAQNESAICIPDGAEAQSAWGENRLAPYDAESIEGSKKQQAWQEISKDVPTWEEEDEEAVVLDGGGGGGGGGGGDDSPRESPPAVVFRMVASGTFGVDVRRATGA